MKSFYFFLFLLLSSFAMAQEGEIKDFKSSSNKYYVGASVSPVFVALLNAQNYQAEWKLGYKQRLGLNNHYLRISYSYLNQRNYYHSIWFNGGMDRTVTIDPNDSMDWRSGYFKNVNNNQNIKFGYEYQFKIGEKRSTSINLGSDFILGFLGGKLFYANDTTTYAYENIDGFMLRTPVDMSINHDLISRAKVYYGLSPMMAIGIPLKKRFDLTLEMAFDIAFRKIKDPSPNTASMTNVSVDYRPSLMISYRFDEKIAARSQAQKRR